MEARQPDKLLDQPFGLCRAAVNVDRGGLRVCSHVGKRVYSLVLLSIGVGYDGWPAPQLKPS